MDRSTIYTSEQGRSIDFLFAQRATMIGLAKQAQAMLGSGTVVRGLAVTQNSPAALNVLVGIGEIYSMEDVDATAWGSLGADTTDVILKQGLNMSSQTLSTPAPATSGYSINYLIEAQYQDQDTNAAVLPFFNSANPQQPLNGQGGNGAALSTQRQGVCVIQAKAGIAAPTGTQVTPSVDSGWTGIAVVTVAYGQTSVGSGNIAPYAGVPLVTNLLQMMQEGSTNYAIDSSATANTIALLMTPALAAYTDGQEIAFKAANNNTGPCTINAGAGSVNLVGAAGAFQGGEIIAGRQYAARYSATLAEFVLSSQSAGAFQVNTGTQPEHAVQFSQIAGVAGTMRNAKMSVAAASATSSWSADEVVLESALGGLRYCVANASASINLATIGAGGMDAGTAPVSGFVAIYGIYNPSTSTFSLLAANATASAAPSVYAGGHMPSGYTASALLTVWPTNSSGQFIVGYQADREFWFTNTSVLSAGAATSYTAVSISSAVPANAKSIEGLIYTFGSIASVGYIAGSATGIGEKQVGGYTGSSQPPIAPFSNIPLISAQTLYYKQSGATGVSIYLSGYKI